MRAAAVLVIVLGSVTAVSAQEVIEGTTTAIDFTGYAGTGLTATPVAGQLDSDAWRVAGLSGGDSSWGGVFATAEFARGAAAGMVSEGGLWAFTVAPSDVALGLQQTGGELTPGDVVVRFRNETGDEVVEPTVRFEIWVRNDSGRASSIAFSWSTDDAIYVPVNGLDAVSTADDDASPIWQVVPLEATLTGATIAAGGMLHLRWHVDNAGGNGGYDELAIDDLELDAPPPPIEPDAGPGGGDEVPEDLDEDDDGVLDVDDNCPTIANANQADDDADGNGDACDDFDRGGEASYGCAAGGGDGGLALIVVLLGGVLRIRASRRTSSSGRSSTG